MHYIKKFEDITLDAIGLVGGKNASLGQMIKHLQKKGIAVPTGFAITAEAYWYYIKHNNFLPAMKQLIEAITDYADYSQVHAVGNSLRMLLQQGEIPGDLAEQIVVHYDELSRHYGQDACDVAVRSSATAEDLPDASFAGQQETYLNVRGHQALMQAYKQSVASLFTDRAIVYRAEKGFDHFEVALSVGVQKMIRSDKAVSGVMFTLDTDNGFREVVMINASYGLGEMVVKGEVTPDEFYVHKPTLQAGYRSIIRKTLGAKDNKLVYADDGQQTKKQSVALADQHRWSLTDDEILELARMGLVIEEHYSHHKGSWCPMDIEWAKDGVDGRLYIIQARPETVFGNRSQQAQQSVYELAHPRGEYEVLATGSSIGQAIAHGRARVIDSVAQGLSVQEGDIIVTHMTDPDWVPLLKKAAGIITSSGGRTCHAAIVSRELGIPAIVGVTDATRRIQSGESITLDCSRGSVGYIYKGLVPFTHEPVIVDQAAKNSIPALLMVNVADPANAFKAALLPADGVGLARIEFIITNNIKVHPMACVQPEKVTDPEIQAAIQKQSLGFDRLSDFFVDTLAYGIATIAAAFYPRPVVVRTSDFKSNEYKNLIAGSYFEPVEENPMLGLRGASRYYDASYHKAFLLECAALKKVRDEMGLNNVKVMVPFVRTVAEAGKVIDIMRQQGLERAVNGLELIMMCEIPSNVILIDEFSRLFDGFSIGSNDLTQLTLGVDRDSGTLSALFDERDEAVKKMLELAVRGAVRNNKHISICGQAPSDYPELAKSLISWGINALSLNVDSIIPFINSYSTVDNS